ncbi:MAG: DUF2064 domain-containing protein [Bacteroidota bacterium]
MQDPVAILFFSRSELEESQSKELLKGKDAIRNRHLFKALERRTLQVIEKSKLPVYHLNENQQIGATFGERLANAFEKVFSSGYDSVICVGNDASDLNHVNWILLTEELSQGKNVIGPDLRQGAYLIGITKECFNKSVFQQLRWQTSYLINDLRGYCKEHIELIHVRDINTSKDLTRAMSSMRLLRYLIINICHYDLFLYPLVLHKLQNIARIVSLRAPPYPSMTAA